MTYKQILAQGPEKIAKLSLRELRAQVRILANTANRRIDRLQKAGLETPATYDPITNKRMSKIRAQGRTFGQLRSEFVRAARFLEAQTSTVTGARKWIADSIEGLERMGVTGITGENFKTLWKAFEQLKALDPSVQNRELKYRVLKEIEREMKSGNTDADHIAEIINGKLANIYEDSQQRTTASGSDLDFWQYEEEEEEE